MTRRSWPTLGCSSAGVTRAAVLAALVVGTAGCGTTVSQPAESAPNDATLVLVTPPVASPQVAAGSVTVSGRVVRLTSTGLVIESDGRQVEVRLDQAKTIWRESAVAASSLQVGDDVFIAGIAATPFVARDVWANIGRIDGIIKALDATGMEVETSLRAGGTRIQRVDFSPYVQYGPPDGRAQLTREALMVGRTISAVVYMPRGGPYRATRIW